MWWLSGMTCVDGGLLLSSYGLSSVCVCPLISSYKDANYVELEPTLMTSFKHNYLVKDPMSKF